MGVREEKEQIVDSIAERFTRSKTMIVTDYRGLNVAEVTELRKQLREAGVEFEVLKNTMSRRAAQKAHVEGIEEYLKGPSALAFGYDDVVAPAKVLFNFAKKHKALELKGGIVEGRVISPSDVENLASLPSRDGLLSMLLSVLQAPMRNLAYSLKQVADKNGEAVAE
jgi:large subunit ribosomal protein L10